MQYRETPPSPRFASLVKCFWSLQCHGSNEFDPEPVVPDGCVEIIFNLSDRFRRYHANGAVETQSSTLIVGQMSRSILIGPTGNVQLFGIRFRPAGAFPFFGFGMNALADCIEPLSSIWGGHVLIFEERLAEADGFESRVSIAESILAGYISEKCRVYRSLQKAVDLISLTNGTTPIHRIAKDSGLSERGLERHFKQAIGLTPKTFSRIVRFQRVLKMLESADPPDILNTALLFGYCDQSHLINDFNQFSGTTPVAFLKKTYQLTENFISAD